MVFAVVGGVVAVSAVLMLAGPRRWIGRLLFGRPVRNRPVRERLPGRVEADVERRASPTRRVPADAPMARSRAIELANRRSIRWKDQT